MSASPATAERTRSAVRRRPSRSAMWRRRIALGAGLALVIAAVLSLVRPADHAVQEIKLPLRHDDIIRQQAADKGVDASLIAAVIYTESHFRDQTSHAGATGLMQLLPSTAHYIAHKSGGTAFVSGDLSTPQINISYGSWYLRYLLDKYDGNEELALAAYNAGAGAVDRFGKRIPPYRETRDYVKKVLANRSWRSTTMMSMFASAMVKASMLLPSG